MTTPVTQHTDTDPSRERLPPVEARELVHVGVESRISPAYETKADPDSPPGPVAKAIGHWIHEHRDAPKKGAGFYVYQYVRSALASIPYGLSMAGVLAGFTVMEKGGAQLAETANSGFGRAVGRNMKAFAGFGPAKMSALIGASFTFYRGTSKLGKWMTEYLFNPKDTEQRTAEKVDDLPQELWRKVKEIAPAESASTPVAAIVLGFIVSAFDKTKHALVDNGGHSLDWTQSNLKAQQGLGNKLKLMGSVVAHPNAKFVSQAVVNTFGYSLFFEMGDRLFKDTQIRRGVWPGEHNSIKALKAAPDEYEQGIKDGNAAPLPKFEGGAVEAAPEKSHHSFFTSEPGVGRFVFRRLLPTAAGITAYTAVKMRWGPMFGNNFCYDKGITAGQFGKKAFGEGLATSLFFLIPIFSEPWEKAYDEYFAKKDKAVMLKKHPELMAEKALTPHQEGKYQELLGRVNAHTRDAANDAQMQIRA